MRSVKQSEKKGDGNGRGGNVNWKSTGSVNAMLLDAKTNFYTNKIQEIGNDQKKLFAAANTLLHVKNETKLPVHVSSFELAERFSTFFEEKIVDIRRELSVTATRGVSYLEHCQRCPCEFKSPLFRSLG